MSDQDIIDYIRLILGDISPEILPDETINTFLQMEKFRQKYPEHPERLPILLYNLTVSCVRWLMMKELSAGTASITERLEKIGDETIQVKGGSIFQSWKDFLDWLLDNPDWVDPSLDSAGKLVIVGGVRQDEFNRVKYNQNSRGPFDVAGIIPQTGVPWIPVRHPKRRYFD